MNFIRIARTIFDNAYNCLIFSYKHMRKPNTLKINGKVLLCGCSSPNIKFGKNVTINSSVRANSFDGNAERTLLTVFDGASLVIGNNVGISNSTIVCKKSITIEDNVYIGVNCVIYDTDMHGVRYADRIQQYDNGVQSASIFIGEGSWICGHCIILKGVHIGKRSVVAAGSVVTKDIPDDELWGGNPCKFIRKLNNKDK